MAGYGKRWKALLALVAISWSFCVGCSDSGLTAEGEQSFTLYHSRWTKVCVDNNDLDLRGCIVGKEGRLDSGKFAGALTLAEGQSKPVLRVRFPLGMQLVHGTRLIVDNNPPVQARYLC